MNYGYRRPQPILPTSLNDIDLPRKHFNVMASISSAPAIEPRPHTSTIDDIPIEKEVFDVSDVSTPSMMFSSINAWQTSTYVGTFFFRLNSHEHLVHRVNPLRRRPQVDRKENWTYKCLLVKQGECLNTTAKPAVIPYRQKRHPKAQNKLRLFTLQSNFKSKTFMCIPVSHTCTLIRVTNRSP